MTDTNPDAGPANLEDALKDFAASGAAAAMKAMVEEAAKKAAAGEAARKAAKAQAQRQRNEAKKAKQRESAKVAREEKGIALPDNVKLNPLGLPENDYATCFAILEMNVEPWGMAYDILAEQHVFRGEVPWQDHYGRELSDDIVAITRNQFIFEFGVTYNHADIDYALRSLSRGAPFNPIAEYIDGCVARYDGVKRLPTILRDYFGADDDEYHSAIGCRYFMAGVARIREPGTKFDHAMVFEGLGGVGKSTGIEILASEEYFSDAPIGDFLDRDASIALQGVWLYEMGEMNGVKDGNLDAVKQFLSTKVDRYRAINGKRREKHPRMTLFVGSVNDYTWLQDKERRFWPCRTKGETKLDELARDRDMIWAEASIMEAEALAKLGTKRRSGKHLMLPRELWIVAGEQQADRRIVDPWEDVLREALAEKELIAKRKNELFDRIHSMSIFEDVLKLPLDQQNTNSAKKVSKIMQRLGWRHKNSLRINKKVLSGYVREDAWDKVKSEENSVEK